MNRSLKQLKEITEMRAQRSVQSPIEIPICI